MPKINVLDKSVAELIAAGEVIDRPVSVIKEAVENAVDAGARQITVEIMRGGVTFMRVTDDGCGISAEDMPLAFIRHATSKVKNAEDLQSIATMGFRGEALASVAAVARVELLSRQRFAAESEYGSRFVIEGGENAVLSETGCPFGTTLIVRDLFFNTPARLKFLRKDVSEGNAIAALVDKLALIHPEIAFKFIRDNTQVRLTGGDGKLYSAMYAVFGKQFAASMAKVEFSLYGVGVSGYISQPLFGRGNRAMQYFYVNRRYIRSPMISAALEEAYRGAMMTGKFPAAVLNITIDPLNVDVNVSPSKTEVRFANEKVIFDAVCFAAKNAIMGSEPDIPDENQQTFRNINRLEPVLKPQTVQPVLPVVNLSASFSDYKKAESKTEPDISDISDMFSLLQPEHFVSAKTEAGKPEKSEYPDNKAEIRVIGELWRTYILCEGDSLYLIDKHAAHERIRFNELKRDFCATSQLLAESAVIPLDSSQADLLLSYKALLLDAGLEIAADDAGVAVLAMPGILGTGDISGIIGAIIEILQSGNEDVDAVFDDILHNMACRGAVKAHDKTNGTDITLLAKRVMADNTLRFCPHGRPIVAEITKNFLEKSFGRLG